MKIHYCVRRDVSKLLAKLAKGRYGSSYEALLGDCRQNLRNCSPANYGAQPTYVQPILQSSVQLIIQSFVQSIALVFIYLQAEKDYYRAHRDSCKRTDPNAGSTSE